MTLRTITREQWLRHATHHLTTRFSKAGLTVPRVRVSCSWPGGGSAYRRIGECWPREASKAGVNEIFISPKIDDGARAVSILAHEICHAIDDCQHGHKGPFAAIGRTAGLEGKPTQMELTPDVAGALNQVLIAAYGPYPHHALDLSCQKRQRSRMIRCTCSECGAIWRMSRTVIAGASGGLHCPACTNSSVEVG
jgi:hypothetical protein